MFLIISEQNIIMASSDGQPDEVDCALRNEFIIEIPDSEFTNQMIGAIYDDTI